MYLSTNYNKCGIYLVIMYYLPLNPDEYAGYGYSNGKVLATVNRNKTKLKHVYDKDNDLGYDILMFPDRKEPKKYSKQ